MKSLSLIALCTAIFSTSALASEADINLFKNWTGVGENSLKLNGVDPNGQGCQIMIGQDGIFGMGVSFYPRNSNGNLDLNKSLFAYVYREVSENPHGPSAQKVSASDMELRVHTQFPGGFDHDNILGIPIPYSPTVSDIKIIKNDLIGITSVSISLDYGIRTCEKLRIFSE